MANKDKTILVVEDEENLSMLIEYNLNKVGYKSIIVSDGEQAMDRLKESKFDLVILDWMIPKLSGIEVCRRIRGNSGFNSLPIIMLTALGDENDKIRGLDTGADDYLTKPFSFPELIARIKALLRRSNANEADEIKVGDISIDLREYKVTRSGKEIDIGPTEFKLLNCLIKQPRRVFSREQLLDHVWGVDNINVEIRTVDVHIGRLRKALNIKGTKDPIRTVRSAGYSLEN